MTKNNLTPLQICFIEEYIKDLDPVQAAMRAGYSPEYAKKNAAKLLHEPIIIEKINAAAGSSTEKLQLKKAFFVQKLLKILEFATQNEEVTDKSGMPSGKVKMRDVSAALKSLEILLKLSSANSSVVNDKPTFSGIENLDISSL